MPNCGMFLDRHLLCSDHAWRICAGQMEAATERVWDIRSNSTEDRLFLLTAMGRPLLNDGVLAKLVMFQ